MLFAHGDKVRIVHNCKCNNGLRGIGNTGTVVVAFVAHDPIRYHIMLDSPRTGDADNPKYDGGLWSACNLCIEPINGPIPQVGDTVVITSACKECGGVDDQIDKKCVVITAADNRGRFYAEFEGEEWLCCPRCTRIVSKKEGGKSMNVGDMVLITKNCEHCGGNAKGSTAYIRHIGRYTKSDRVKYVVRIYYAVGHISTDVLWDCCPECVVKIGTLKEGDRVKVVKSDCACGGGYIGEAGAIEFKEIKDSTGMFYKVKFDNGGLFWQCDQCIKLIKSAPEPQEQLDWGAFDFGFEFPDLRTDQ